MTFNKSKKFYLKGDSYDNDSSNGLLVESFLCDFTTPANYHYFNSDIKTLLGTSITVMENTSDCNIFSLNPNISLGTHNINGSYQFHVFGLNEAIESPTDVAPISENAGTSGIVVLRVLFFGLTN